MRLLLTAFAAVIVAAGSAFADLDRQACDVPAEVVPKGGMPEAGPNADAFFASIDRDENDALSLVELQSARADWFRRADQNGDGYVDRDELEEIQSDPFRKHIVFDYDSADRDGDGLLSLAEIQNQRSPWFRRLDAAGDGIVTREEFDAARDAALEKLSQYCED